MEPKMASAFKTTKGSILEYIQCWDMYSFFFVNVVKLPTMYYTPFSKQKSIYFIIFNILHLIL